MQSKRDNCFTMTDDMWEGYKIAYNNIPQNPSQLWDEFQKMSDTLHDGRYTIFKYKAGFKVAFGTPTLFKYSGVFQEHLLPNFNLLIQAIEFAVMWNIHFDNLRGSRESV